MSRNYSIRDIKLLYSLSAGRCNLCGKELFESKINEQGYIHLGEMAHIYSYADNEIAPRYIDSLSGNNSYENLILLCCNDHKRVDDNPAYYTVKKLREIKRTFENHVCNCLSKQMNSSDKALIYLIRENFNLQNILSSLNMPLSYLPWSIGDIADIEKFILIPNKPSFYPFDNEILNQKMKNMLRIYEQLFPYIMEYYFSDDGVHLVPTIEKPIKDVDKEEILKIVTDFRKSIYEWLEYCRLNYS